MVSLRPHVERIQHGKRAIQGTSRKTSICDTRNSYASEETLAAVAPISSPLSELRLSEVRNIQTDHDRWRRAQPPTRRRTRDSDVRRHGHVPGALDEIPKPVVVALRAGRGRHGNDHRPFPHAAQLLADDGERPLA